MDESEIIPINDYDSDFESETDSKISINDSRSIDSFSDDFDFDDENDDLSQARNFYEIDCNNPSAPPPRFAFTNTHEIHLDFDASSGKMQYYEALIDNNLIDLIVHETNRYAEQTIGSSIPRKHSRSKKWEPTSNKEMPVFIALIILQGIVKKTTNEQYWSKRHSISTPFFSKVMSYRRFNLIYRFLHFSNNETFVTETHECPKLSKIWPVLKYLTIRFKEVVTPDRDVTIEESLMLFKGRLGWKQYMPLKRSRFGIKSYMLCESKSGYVWSLIIYTVKGTLFDEKYKHMCMSSQVVMTLMEPLLNKGHCLTTDNFYSSPELADILIQSLTDMYGTLKPRRKDVPKELLSKKIDKGQMIAYQRGRVCVMKWMDKKAVCLISTMHNPEMVQVQSHKNEIRRKHKAVMEYNNAMGGVDRLDKHLTNYPLIKKKKRGKREVLQKYSFIYWTYVCAQFLCCTKKMVEKTLICSLEWTLLIA
ncbi:piggyBac transposable element-derived protein 4 [Trichonephila clavipes]|nr:piggyBac transposable element-derived protein 4 [Trichonephila clavipes]